MRREDKFVLSRRSYAVNLSSLRSYPAWCGTDTSLDELPGNWLMVDAVWFRRRKGATVACAGYITNSQDQAPADASEFLTRIPARFSVYGGTCLARWDGKGFWAAGQDPEENARFLELLRPMLAAFPECPAGWDGWWVF